VIGRLSSWMTARSTLTDIMNASDRLSHTQKQLSSGKALTKPSDDPAAVGRSLRVRADLSAIRQYERNTQDASSWQDVTDGALGSIGDMVLRARELLLQASSDSAGADARKAAAAEISQLVDGIKSAANTQYAGRYVFGGAETQQAPYALGASDAFAGDTTVIQREIGPGVTIDLNTIGSDSIGDDAGGLLKTLRTIVSDLQGGNGAALRSADLQALDAGHQAVLDARTAVGARSQRLELADARLSQLEEVTTGHLSNLEDADLAETLMHFSTQQAVYQAALRAGSQMLQPSLMDYLNL